MQVTKRKVNANCLDKKATRILPNYALKTIRKKIHL
jgi:hypothetical protein